MSLPAMLVGETVGEILQASQFAREIVAAVEGKLKKIESDDPKTPMGQKKDHKAKPENTELRARRKREKQVVFQEIRMESDSPILRRARSRITFKVSPNKREIGKENLHVAANRVSPKNKPWAKKTVLFPNPLFHPLPTSQQHKFGKTRSPVITRTRETPLKFHSPPTSNQHKPCKTRSPVTTRPRETPHKFLIKTPPSNSKFQVKIKSPPITLSPVFTKTRNTPHKFLIKTPPSNSKFQVKIKNPPVTLSPTRASILNKKPQKVSTATKLRRSLSPAKLASRFVSPLKNRLTTRTSGGFLSGLKQHPSYSSRRLSDWRA